MFRAIVGLLLHVALEFLINNNAALFNANYLIPMTLSLGFDPKKET